MRVVRLAPYLVGMSLLAACQPKPDLPPAVSLEEAKRVTASFQEQAFVPPPRTTRDIVALLDEASSTKLDVTAQLQAQTDASPPTGASQAELSQFLLKRASAARLLGRYRQAIDDAKAALELDAGVAYDANGIIARAHDELGNHESYVTFARQMAVAADNTGSRIVSNSHLALALANTGDFDGADAALAAAKSEARETYSWSGRGAAYAPIIRNLARTFDGKVAYKRGAYAQAEETLRTAIAGYEEDIRSGADGSLPVRGGNTLGAARLTNKTYALRSLGQALMRQDRLAEAEALAREALIAQARYFGRYSGQTAEGVGALTEILIEQGRYEEAAALAEATIDILERMGVLPDSVTLAKARQTLSNAHVGLRRWDEAVEVFSRIAGDLASDPDAFTRLLKEDLTWVLALVRSRQVAEAIKRLRPIVGDFTQTLGPRHYRTAEAEALLAAALAAGGSTDEAILAFTDAVPILLTRSKRAEHEGSSKSGRQLRLQFILESYLDALWRRARAQPPGHERDGTVADAFRVANAARGGVVQRALSSSASRAAIGDSELADLARREQDTLYRIAALNGRLADATGDTRALLERSRLLEASRAAIMAEIEARFPSYAQLIDPRPATVDDARATLVPGEALIATYVGDARTYVWTVPRRGVVAFNATDIGRDELADTVATLRSALDPQATTLGDIPEFDVATAHRLYATLLAPVHSGWKDADSLLVVAHGPLGHLPFSLLPTQSTQLPQESGALFSNYRAVPWLARSHAVTVLPSVGSLRTLRSLPPGDVGRKAFAGFGDPVFDGDAPARKSVETTTVASRGLRTRALPVRLRAAPATGGLQSAGLSTLPPLPDTADEIRSIAVVLGADLSSDVFLGTRANEGMVKTLDLAGYRVLAFATHGLVPGDLDGLTQPALALSSPQAARDTDNDGLLTMGEILRLRLNADWVVLSACNTGSAQGAGAEAVSGLGRAFFYAGSRALLVSNWPVESTSARALTIDLFQRQAAADLLTRAEALRQSMVTLIDGPGYVDSRSGETVFSYAHPIFWAPFSLIGDGGVAGPDS